MSNADKIDALFPRNPLGRLAAFAGDERIAAERDGIEQVVVAAAREHAQAAYCLWPILVNARRSAREQRLAKLAILNDQNDYSNL